MNIFISHTGVNKYEPELTNINAESYLELVDKINQMNGYSEFKNYIVNNNKISSGARIFTNIVVNHYNNSGNEIYKFYESEETFEVSNLYEKIPEKVTNILFAIFDAELLLKMVNNSLTDQGSRLFGYRNKLGVEKKDAYKSTIEPIQFEYYVKKENIYGFKNGETTLESLKFSSLEEPMIEFNEDGFIKEKSRILPEDLVDAVREIWELPDKVGTLRLFQEDSLFFIMAKLLRTKYPKEKQLLLSMPTGGGKTEAFMIPLLSRIYYNKVSGQRTAGIQSIVIYPTNALANDQAMRFVELIYKINRRLSENDIPLSKHISIGILSGDTPNKSKDLSRESLIRICPKCGKTNEWQIDNVNEMVCHNVLSNGRICGTKLTSFCRLTKEDIVSNPPDILITNPDMINYALHSPKYLPIFINKIESIVFDEVHVYQGILGCHVSHLLRRLEEVMDSKPLYIGMSATIGNARELASLLFDEKKENICYIRNVNNKYMTDKIVKTRLHAIISPYFMGEKITRTGGIRERYVRAMTVAGTLAMFIGHLISDSHFRKSIIFTNYRADADKLATDLREREQFDIKEYFNEIMSDIKSKKPLSDEEKEICLYIDRWIHEVLDNNNAINDDMVVGWNRGGLEKEERIRSIHSFSRNSLLAEEGSDDAAPIDIMVATKTLEVGIDIGDVTTVINSSAPFTVNEYVQRVGRAGRKKDSLAITAINPESAIDCHMRNHFDNYVYAKEADYEDAPIIINNQIIIERHVRARIVDYYTKMLLQIDPNTDLQHISIGDIVDRISLIKNGSKLSIGDGVSSENVESYADCLYEKIFEKNFEGETIASRFINFLKKEEDVINTEPCDLTENSLKDVIRSVVREIQRHLDSNSKEGKWEKTRFLVGRDNNAAMPELTPSLRGAGATVSLYINNSEDAVDVVSRQTAFYSMPISNEYAISTTTSGVSSFIILDDKGESDHDAEIAIRGLIIKDDKAIDYFNSKLDNFPYSEDPVEIAIGLDVKVPNKLRVGYYPTRFYCNHCHRGLLPNEDYIEKSDGVYCKKCGRKATQLHKIYACESDSCGQLYDPPIPKFCINPDCSSTKAAYKIYQNNNYSFKGISKEIRDCFSFRLTNELEWVCNVCKARINYTQYHKMGNGNSAPGVQRILADRSLFNSKCIDYFPKLAKSSPETPTDKEHALKPVYTCRVCPSKKIKPVSVPRVRTVAYNFIGNKAKNHRKQVLCESLNKNNLAMDFYKGYVIQLAQEFVRRFSNGTKDNTRYTLKTEKIFDKRYWGNYFESHLAWFRFDSKIDYFLSEKKYTCDGNCSKCNKFETLDLGDMMKPRRIIEDYNYDSTQSRPKKPDHRGKYCHKAKENVCIRQYCQLEDGGDICKDFNIDEYLRYLIVHTIKHGIIWSLPKYAGVNVSEIKGEVYPNDRETGNDLVLIDSNEGGSGAILLVRKHWDQIWKFTNDIISDTCEGKANIILPHSCARFNADLCPFITKEYLDFIK